MMRIKVICFFLVVFSFKVNAQSFLAQQITLNIAEQKLSTVLDKMEKKGNFRFSYNSNILPVDSLITLHAARLNMAEALDTILNNRFEYHQSGNFIIIRYAPAELILRISESAGNTELYTIKGQIVDKHSAKPIANASIYEKNLLLSAITDHEGHFYMRFKKITQPISLTVTKENYKSTIAYFLPEVNITGSKTEENEPFFSENLEGVEETWLGQTLVTAKQQIQSINLGKFISKAPFQFALVPGLNSHGLLSGQVVNKFSLNVVGAYSAGVDGAEIGFIFNIDKGNVQYFQFGGAFNLVGGNVRGAQIGGLFNQVMGGVNGVQIGAAFNRVNKSVNGVQIGGIYNQINQQFTGLQISLGLNSVKKEIEGMQIGALNVVGSQNGMQIGMAGNMVKGSSKGMQIAGIANLNRESKSFQLAGLANYTQGKNTGMQMGAINYAHHLKGVQFGLFNFANENDGYAIGLLNVALKGYHKFSFTTNESTELNVAYKGGSKRLYNMLMFGMNTPKSPKIYTLGLGFGKEISLFKRVALNPEISSQYVYQGNWSYVNLLNKFELPINIRINKWLAIQGGPSVNLYYAKQHTKIADYGLLQEKHRDFSFKNPNYTGWFGWNVGLVLF